MVTKNYKKIVLTTPHAAGSTSYRYGNYVYVDGTAASGISVQSVGYYVRYNFRVVLGSGTTEPTENDYRVESAVNLTVLANSNDQSSVANSQITNDNYMYFGKATIVVRNDNNNDVTINEICGYGKSGSGTTAKEIMLCRSVVSPVTIHPGETYIFTCSIGRADS